MARKANQLPPEKNTPLKDLDLLWDQRKLTLYPDMEKKLLEQLKSDCDFLESQNVINYALLIGFH